MEKPSSNPVLLRAAATTIEKALRASPVVVVLGARQTGKTTLIRSMPSLAKRPYLTLDDFDLRTHATSDPDSVVARAPKLILDEVQRAKDLLIAVKHAVDKDKARTPGRFVLTGSANLLMMEKISESLAGRALYITLWPLSRRERHGFGRCGVWSELLANKSSDWRDVLAAQDSPQEGYKDAVRLGGLPVPAHQLQDDEARSLWFSGYIQTYLERDLQALRTVENLSDFRRLMRAAALRIGNLLNQTELGRDVGISQVQVHRFLNLMEASFQIIRMPAYSVNKTRRMIKTPKLYWCDTALAMHLAGEHEPRGAHLENLIANDLIAWRDTQARSPEIMYWRTATGEEVDFVIETPKRLLPIEIKAATRVTPRDAHSLHLFLDDYGKQCDGGLLLYGGNEVFPVSNRVWAVPWWQVC